jgi:hypothetical protein
MHPQFLALLSEPVQAFVRQVEECANINIEVILSSKLNGSGPLGQGRLEVVINAQCVQLFAPTDGYFPEGGVRHEVLHVHRFHVDGVPKLALADDENWDRGYSDALGALDNAVEHIVIVPVELKFHPERRVHWEAVMDNVCSELHLIPEDERCLAGCLHWTFLRHVLPDSPCVEIARTFLIQHELFEFAEKFADNFLSFIASKEEMIRFLFFTFPEIPKSRAALEYINSITGTHQKPIS